MFFGFFLEFYCLMVNYWLKWIASFISLSLFSAHSEIHIHLVNKTKLQFKGCQGTLGGISYMEIRINLFKKAIYFYYLTSIQGCQGTLCDIWYNALGNKMSASIKKWQILLKFLPTFSCHKSLWKYQISLDIHLTYSVSTLLEFLRPRKSIFFFKTTRVPQVVWSD
jgi:hypothetical protein